MANCRNCVHYAVCRFYEPYQQNIKCNHYKNKADKDIVKCKDCEYLMFSDCYGECSKGYMGIVSPYDFCSNGMKRRQGSGKKIHNTKKKTHQSTKI